MGGLLATTATPSYFPPHILRSQSCLSPENDSPTFYLYPECLALFDKPPDLIVSIGPGMENGLSNVRKYQDFSKLTANGPKVDVNDFKSYITSATAIRIQPANDEKKNFKGAAVKKILSTEIDSTDVLGFKTNVMGWLGEIFPAIGDLARRIIAKQFYLEAKRDKGKYIGPNPEDTTRFEFLIKSRLEKLPPNPEHFDFRAFMQPKVEADKEPTEGKTQKLEIGIGKDDSQPYVFLIVPEDINDIIEFQVDVAITSFYYFTHVGFYYPISGSPIGVKSAPGGLSVELVGGAPVLPATRVFYEE